jgi:hypothetical protein
MLSLVYVRWSHLELLLIMVTIIVNPISKMVYSWPLGAGGCIGGKAAVEQSHRSTINGKIIR